MDIMPGDKVVNGSTVVAVHNGVVLCVLTDNAVTPYATWAAERAPEGIQTFTGDYFRNLPDALEGFRQRCGIATTREELKEFEGM